MTFFKRFYAAFGRAELYVVAAILLAISTLVFVSALARTVGHPLNWAVDISMLLFAWMVFLGGDIVIRETNLISVDMFLNKFPRWLQTLLLLVFYLLMLAFLVVLVRYGVPLLMRNWKRVFQSTGISYSWCTMAVPVGAFLMFISTSVRMVQRVFLRNESNGGSVPAPAAEEEIL